MIDKFSLGRNNYYSYEIGKYYYVFDNYYYIFSKSLRKLYLSDFKEYENRYFLTFYCDDNKEYYKYSINKVFRTRYDIKVLVFNFEPHPWIINLKESVLYDYYDLHKRGYNLEKLNIIFFKKLSKDVRRKYNLDKLLC